MTKKLTELESNFCLIIAGCAVLSSVMMYGLWCYLIFFMGVHTITAVFFAIISCAGLLWTLLSLGKYEDVMRGYKK